jgi:uncharacterized membrane protein
MDEFVDAVWFVNLLCAGITAGGQVAFSLGVLPVVRRLDTSQSLRLHQWFLDHKGEWHLPITHNLTVITAIVILVAEHDDAAPTAFAAVGLALSLVGYVVSLAGNIPLNNRLRRENADSPPDDYPALRRRWDLLQLTRTVTGLLAFGCFIVAALAS